MIALGALALLSCRGASRAPQPSADGVAQDSTIPRVALTDSANRPVVVTLRRDSLGLPANAPRDSVSAAMLRAVVELHRIAAFDVLAISPELLALNLRARTPPDAKALARLLSSHRLVESAEVAAVLRPQ